MTPKLSLPRRLAVTVLGVTLGGLAACTDTPPSADATVVPCPCYCVAVDGGDARSCSAAAIVQESDQCPEGCRAVEAIG